MQVVDFPMVVLGTENYYSDRFQRYRRVMSGVASNAANLLRFS
jgi:hypothetical protein